MIPNISPDLFINKQGLFGSWWCKSEEVWVPFRVKNSLSNLRQPCTIEKGTTIRDIFCLVKEDDYLKKFLENYCQMISINNWLEIVDQEPVEKNEDFKKIRIWWNIDSYEDELEIDKNISISGKSEMLEEDNISLTFYFNEALDLPIELDENVQTFCYGEDDEQLLGNKNNKKYFSLLDILDVIFFEISPYSSPESLNYHNKETRKRIDKLQDRVEDMKNKVLNNKNLEELGAYPLSSVLERIDKAREEAENSPCKYCGKINNAIDNLELRDFDADIGFGRIVCTICNKEIKEVMFDPETVPEEF